MSFVPNGSLSSNAAPVLRKAVVGNNVVLPSTASVKASSGFLALGTAGATVFGNVQTIQTFFGVGMNTTGVAGADVGSFVGTFTMASDNQTVAKVSAHCDVSKQSIYSADSTAALGTTTGSNLLGYTTDLSTSLLTDESTALTTTGQYFIWGVDPLDSGNQLVSIYESQVLGV